MDRVINCLTEMMIEGRGYILSESEEVEIPDTEILNFSETDGKLICFVCKIHTLNNKYVKMYVSHLIKNKVNHAIIVYNTKITSEAKKIIKNLDIKIELFLSDHMRYNPTKHKYVPVHIQLDSEESSKFKKKFGEKIPVILTSDPISKYYGFNKGRIIKIIRKDKYVCYRIVK